LKKWAWYGVLGLLDSAPHFFSSFSFSFFFPKQFEFFEFRQCSAAGLQTKQEKIKDSLDPKVRVLEPYPLLH